MFLGKPLTRDTYIAVRELQGNKCPILGTSFLLGVKALEAADHDHKTGEFRGVLSGGKKGANMYLVGRYENDKRSKLNPAAIAAIEAYLADPPVAKYLRSLL